MSRDVMKYVRPNILAMTPYSTARDEYKGKAGIFLDANENPYENGVNRYPDPTQAALKEQLSAIKGVAVENIFVGNGSDEAIDLCYRIFCEPRISNAVAIAPSYGMYRVAAATNDVELREVQLNDDYSLPVERLLAATDGESRLMFLCSPNNPTGNIFPREEVLELAERFDGILVVDEAYIDFADQPSLLNDLAAHPNLIVLQTLSKAWGMAGLRLGLAFASAEVMELFARVKYPYNINVTGMAAATDILAKGVDEQVAEIVAQRQRVMAELSEAECVKKVFPSEANFVLARVSDARRLYNALIDEGVIVRDRSSVKGCDECLRITIGTPEENDKMLEIVKRFK